MQGDDPVTLLIFGTRTFADYDLLRDKCDRYTRNCTVVEVVSGGAKGADALGERWAKERGIPVRQFPADWKKHGKAAGPLRNREMARYLAAHSPAGAVGFWDGESRGTRDMIGALREVGVRCKVVPTCKQS